MRALFVLGVMACAVLSLLLPSASAQTQSHNPPFDIVLRNGTILDGSGGRPYKADVGISSGAITAIGDLRSARAVVDVNVRGLFVTPGFINIHSHAAGGALPIADNMLTQGVTTEILNPDGGGSVDLAEQLSRLAARGLAVNIGAYIGFNAVWQAVVGAVDRRPTEDDFNRMGGLVERGLEQGAWGVSAGLDYVPGRYASTDEVVRVLQVARKWRTNFPNHERLTQESDFSSRVGISETLAIARAAGLLPVITHIKAGRREGSTAQELVAMMATATRSGLYTAADVYPYLAGFTRLGALLIPGWAQEGGRDDMLKRFADPALRARIITETEEALRARFGGADGVYLPGTRQELVEVMQAQNISAGEAIVRILELAEVRAILRFGVESDVVAFLQNPTTSIACDCGATTTSAVHPRFFGTYPRVLGRYVREQKLLTWAEAIRKMTALPAATIGMVDRGFLAAGMAADVTVFDPNRIVDRATYEHPARLSQGIQHVIVNGRMALRNGQVTGEQGGRILARTGHMPSRPMSPDDSRRVSARTRLSDVRTAPSASAHEATVELDVRQGAGDRRAAGFFRFHDSKKNLMIEATEFGILQVADGWATFSGRARMSPSGAKRPFKVIVDQAGPFRSGAATVWVNLEGFPDAAVPLASDAVRVTPSNRK
jgi:N-acyl-D-aspartate/D-glutamate deacylase